MATNPVERNVVTRFVFGFAVIAATMLGAGAVGGGLRTLAVPYGAWIGAAVGALAVLVAVGVVYTRYDRAYTRD